MKSYELLSVSDHNKAAKMIARSKKNRESLFFEFETKSSFNACALTCFHQPDFMSDDETYFFLTDRAVILDAYEFGKLTIIVFYKGCDLPEDMSRFLGHYTGIKFNKFKK